MTEKHLEEKLAQRAGLENHDQAGNEDEMIDQIAARVLDKYRAAFEELAK